MTPAMVAGLALVAAAGCVAAGSGSARARLAAVAPSRPRSAGRLPWPRFGAPALVAVAGVAGWLFAGPVAALTGAFYTAAVVRSVRGRQRSRADAATARAAFDLIAWLADDLRAGQLPAAALAGAARAAGPALDPQSRSALVRAAGEASAGHSAVPALRSIGHRATEAVFGRLAAVFAVADAGIPLADLLAQLDSELRAQRRAAEKAAAQLAAARATAALLSALPLLGLLMGEVLGADPVRVLFGTLTGGLCLLGAMVLHSVGAVWVHRTTVRAVAP